MARRLLSDLQPANRPRPTGADNDYLPDPCVLHPERVTDYPNWDLPDEVADALEARFEQLEEETGWSYWSHLSVSDGVKVGGYPTWTQEPNWPTCPTCRVRMEHLLTISSNEFDGELAHVAAHRGHPGHGNHLGPSIRTTHRDPMPPGLMLGDMGGIYLFECTSCSDRPFAYRSDCS